MWSPLCNLQEIVDLPFWQNVPYNDIIHKPQRKIKLKSTPKVEELRNIVQYGLYHFREQEDLFVHNFVLCTTDELREYHTVFNMG